MNILNYKPLTSGRCARVASSILSGRTPSPAANSSIKCKDGCVRPRSSLEMEETSQRHASASFAWDMPASARNSFSANPNASSVFKRRSLAVIGQRRYRNIFLHLFRHSSSNTVQTHVDVPSPQTY